MIKPNEKIKQLEDEIKETEVEKFVSFATDSVSTKVGSKYAVKSKFNKQQILNLMNNPYGNYLELQKISQWLMIRNGIYFRLIRYMSNLLTYDYFIYPAIGVQKFDKKEKMLDSYEKCALYLNKMSLKYNLPIFTNKLFENGEVFLYELEDTKSIVYKQIPSEYCRISSIEDGVFRYEVNISKIPEDIVKDYPVEFQNLKRKTQGKNNKSQKSMDDISWYPISKKGFAFTLNNNVANNVPPFSFLFPDIMDFEDVKTTQVSDSRDENVKIIHGEVPVDKDTGLPIMDISVISEFNKKIKDALPKGYQSIVNPFKTEVINLKQNLNKEKDMFEITKNNIFEGAGVSDMLFSNDKASSEALKKSIETDAQISYNLIIPMFEAYINSKLKDINSVYMWKTHLLRVSYFNKGEEYDRALKALQLGSSRLYTLSMLGLEPLEIINLLKLEQEVLDIDTLMVAPKSSFTTSGKDVTNKGGRDDEVKTDNGEKSLENR